ncbi:MAG: hypothetical protein KC620_02610 [Myxococcales bacterium]|nr:hypothetical protein [Myxococcales bacterium]
MIALLLVAALLPAPAAKSASVGALLRQVKAEPADPEAPEWLWDAARLERDVHHRPRAAAALMRWLLSSYPESRPAARAQAALDWMVERDVDGDPSALTELLALADRGPEAADRYLERYPKAPDAAVLAMRASLADETDAALTRLARFSGDAEWGWLVRREVGRRQYLAGRYVDAWRTADAAADPAGRARATRVLAWRAAGGLAGLCLLALVVLMLRRRRRLKKRAT